jgi:hypothetical protein
MFEQNISDIISYMQMVWGFGQESGGNTKSESKRESNEPLSGMFVHVPLE